MLKSIRNIKYYVFTKGKIKEDFMNKLKRICIISMLLVFILISLLNVKIFAIDNENVLQQEEYSEEFKRWLELPEEEREKIMMPRPYEIKNTNVRYRSPLYMAKMVKASMNGRYSLKDQIPANLVIKNQKSTKSNRSYNK